MPSAEPSPRPWRVDSDNLTLRPPVCFVVDANGAKVSGGFFSPADAALIVDAVNERDRLRDIVRRMADLSESLLANYEYRYREDANSMAFVGNARDFIREARAAIGEDAK